MNFIQKLILFLLIVLSCGYIYFSFFSNGSEIHKIKLSIKNDFLNIDNKQNSNITKKVQNVKIFLLDKTGKLNSVDRKCDVMSTNSCFSYAISELIKSPSRWEKSKGFTSEIPINTKILSIRESNNGIMIDLSSDFGTGGGAESNYMRMRQLIKTVNANTKLPVYLYMNGNKVSVFGGEGIMIKQPLNGASLDE